MYTYVKKIKMWINLQMDSYSVCGTLGQQGIKEIYHIHVKPSESIWPKKTEKKLYPVG